MEAFILCLCVGRAFSAVVLAQQSITLENSELQVALSPQNATLVSVIKK